MGDDPKNHIKNLCFDDKKKVIRIIYLYFKCYNNILYSYSIH